MKIKANTFLLSFFFILILALVPYLLFAQQIETLENDVFQIREIDLGSEKAGSNLISAIVANRTSVIKNFVLDLRTECFAFGRANWQKQFYFRLQPHEIKKVNIEYEIYSPYFTMKSESKIRKY